MKLSLVKYRIKSYCKYLLRARSRHAVHSPFLFDFIQKVMEPDQQYYVFEKLNSLRLSLAQNEKKINLRDMGAGSSTGKSERRKVSKILNSSTAPAPVAEMLFRLVHYYDLHKQLELGTNLGLTSLYLASANAKNRVVTIEGSQELANVARENFKSFGVENISLLEGEFSDQLPKALAQLEKVDFAFIDGNHRELATLEYFEKILPYTHEGSVLVFDDIHWSPEMERAWEKIVADNRTVLTVDWYRLGIVFFRKSMVKQHFVLKQKP